jgi:hypothetical protein
MFQASHERYDSVKQIHKASFWIAVIISALAVTLLGLSFSFISALNDLKDVSSDSVAYEGLYVVFTLCQNCAIAVAVMVIFTQIFGLFGYAYMNKGLVITYIVFSSLAIIVCVVCIVLPAIASVAITIACDIDRSDDSHYASQENYDAICVQMPARFNTVIAFIIILAVLSFVDSIIGCVNASSVQRKEIVQATYVHTTTAVPAQPPTSSVVVMAQPGYTPYPAQGYPPQGQPYPPQGYPPQGQPYPPQGAYTAPQGSYPYPQPTSTGTNV